MGDQNYDRVLAKIAKTSGVSKEEIERMVEAKRAKLSGLISKEGAAQIIAAELGISFDGEKLKIEELLPGMRRVNVLGQVINIYPIRSFTTKKGDIGKVANFVIADDTSNIKVVLWDTHHIDLIEKGHVGKGTSIEIINASMRDNEIHLGSFSDLKISNVTFENIKTEKVVKEKKIVDFKVSDSLIVRAFIVQAFEPRFFHVCSECKKKVASGVEGFICETHGKVVADKKALMNLVLDDGSETIRAVLFSDALGGLGLGDLENTEELLIKKNSLIGKELFFSGNVRTNKFFNNMEFIVDGVKEVELDELINKFENLENVT
jgi:replication factor A1